MADEAVVGRVLGVQSFPLKSAGGAPSNAVEVLASGVAGDRTWAVAAPTGELITAREAPQLRDVVARLASDGELNVRVPGEDGELTGEGAESALSRLVGRPVRLQQPPEALLDVAPVNLVWQAEIDAAAEQPEQATNDQATNDQATNDQATNDQDQAEAACSTEQPRANLVLDVPDAGSDPGVWVGRQVRVGDVLLRVTRKPKHCLGLYAEVIQAGRVTKGDDVRLT